MSNGANHYELYLAVGGGADDEELDQHQRNLQRELNELDGVTRVEWWAREGGSRGRWAQWRDPCY